MAVLRAPENPVIRPGDVTPSREDFEVIGVLNAGVARLRDEVILLLRIAERPIQDRADVVLCPIYDVDTAQIILKPFARDDPRNDFSDPRLIVARASCPYVTRPSWPRLPRHDASVGPEVQGRDALATLETYLTSISHLRVARSKDGIRFQIADTPAIQAATEYDTFGVEDPRITCIEGVCCVSYVGVSPLGVTTCLASTRDFRSFERRGIIFHPDNKDVAIFPARIDGRYYALHRPHSSLFLRNDIWTAESPDLICWGNHRYLMGTQDGGWDEKRIGAGAPPLWVKEGWLEIYHGADRNNRYCLGAVLLDGEQPWKIVARSETPLFEPEADYERAGFFGNVVFSCGLLFEDEILKIYYGAADTSICYAEIPLADVYANLGL